MFGTLIDNAVKYTPAGGTVDVGVMCRNGLISVEVIDTGPGIDPSLHDRVFDRFFRAAASDVEGSGLGLAVAQAIAKRHGMAVTIANREGQSGLRVTVTGRSG